MNLKSMELNLFGKVNDDPKDHFIHLPITVLNNYTPGVIIKPPDIRNDRYLLSMDNTIFEWRSDISFPESILKEMGWSTKKDTYIVHGKYDANIVQVIGRSGTYNHKQELEGKNTVVIIFPLDHVYNRFYPMHLSKDPKVKNSIDLTNVNLYIRFSKIAYDIGICLTRDLINKLQLEDNLCNQVLYLH